ncbi:hypothetical protein N2152v2_006756 [Parachlorella kessleri]
MGIFEGFLAHVLLIFFSEACQAPYSIMVDAAAAATSKSDSDFGARKLWASVGWGATAPLSGWVVQHYGVQASITIYFAVVAVCTLPTLLLPFDQLGKRAAASRRSSSQGAETSSVVALAGSLDENGRPTEGRAGLGAAAKQHSLQEPLLGGGGGGQLAEERAHGGTAAELAMELDGQLGGGSLEMAEAGSLVLKPWQDKGLGVTVTEKPEAVQDLDLEGGWQGGVPALPSSFANNAPSAAINRLPAGEASRSGLLPRLPPINTHLPVPGSQHGTQLASPLPSARTPGSLTRSHPLAIGSHRRPTSAASLASTAFYTVHSSASVIALGLGGLRTPSTVATAAAAAGSFTARTPQSAMAAGSYGNASGTPLSPSPGGLAGVGQGPLANQISDLSALAGFTEEFEMRLSEQNEGFSSPVSAAAMEPAPLVSPFGDSISSPFAAAIAAEAGAPETGAPPAAKLLDHAGAAVAQVVEAAGAAARLDTAISSALGSATLLQLPRVCSVHPPGFAAAGTGPTNAEQLATSTSGLLPVSVASPLLPPSHIASHHGEPKKEGASTAVSVVAIATGGLEAPCPVAARDTITQGPPSTELSVLGGILDLLRNPHTAAFFFLTLLCGVGYGGLGYLALYLRQQGASGILMGLCQTVNCTGEVAAFLSSSWWLPRLGIDNAFNLVMLGFVVRLGAYVLLPLFPTLWLVLMVEILQGLTFGVLYCAGTINCKRIAAPHLRSTTQSLFFCLYYGVGPGISGLAGGYIYQAIGMRSVFLICSLVILAGWLGTVLLFRLAVARRAKREQGQDDLGLLD